jgi:hypothetical protein
VFKIEAPPRQRRRTLRAHVSHIFLVIQLCLIILYLAFVINNARDT